MSGTTALTFHRANGAYPGPLIVAPAQEHQQTFIILHGRGSAGAKFSPALLAHPISASQTLLDAFPHARFVFPTASRRRALIYKRALTHQWFDNWHLTEPEAREDVQIDGLRETSAYLHGLLRAEIALVGARNVVLWGLSQGCAASLVALLTWEGEPLAAVVGMCGWLPFRKQLESLASDGLAAEGGGGGEGDDLFEADPDAAPGAEPGVNVVAWLREELEMSKRQISMVFRRVPVFLGHGIEDDKVFVDLSRKAAGCLEALGAEVCSKEYEGLGHWYSKEMLCDIKEFIEHRDKIQADRL